MRSITVKINQSLFDIALEQYGSIEGVYWLVEDNELLTGITDNVFPTDTLLIRDEVINNKAQKYLSDYDITTVEDARGSGIGYMRIGIDFKVE